MWDSWEYLDIVRDLVVNQIFLTLYAYVVSE